MPDNSAAPPTAPHKGSLLVIFLAVFIDLLGFGMVLPLLSVYAQDFGAKENGAEIGLLVASFSAMQFLFAPAWGRLSDRIGRRPVLMVGFIGSVVFYALFGLATIWRSMFWLFVSRIGAGIAGATITTAQAYIADTTTLETRGRGMAMIGAAFGLGFTFGPLFGGFTLLWGGDTPRAEPGFFAAGLSAFALALAYFQLPESRRPDSAPAGRKIFNFGALGDALRTPSIGPILLTLFICILAFANFETTLSLLLKGAEPEAMSSTVLSTVLANPSTAQVASGINRALTDSTLAKSPFHFTFQQVMFTFAYVGFTLTVAQGLIVRRLIGKIHEGKMAAGGASLDILGFIDMVLAIRTGSHFLLFAGLTLLVFGFAMMMPSLNSLLSRRSDPAKQGGILGIGQSISALARILGPMIGIPLLLQQAVLPLMLPYVVGAVLMVGGLAMIFVSTRSGHDYGRPAMPHTGMLE